jgi:hypothetical protein
VRVWQIIMIACLGQIAVLANAASIESLLMPGEVTAAHAKVEEECSNCHDRRNRERQPQLCLECHKEVAADIRAHSGYHGRIANIDKAQCKGCHSEHLGRKADIVRLSQAMFNHKLTDFELRGRHQAVDCENCHKPNKPYRDAPHDCASCHQKVDTHQGKLGKDCRACHTELSWSKTLFDHNKTTFPLRDAHTKAPCMACHFGNRYKGTPTQCVSCHAPDDVHRGSRGIECSKCHSTASWKTVKFDHAKQTGFALLGVHAELDCLACHKSGRMQDKIPKDCNGCHRAEDAHASRLGSDCAHCHGSVSWKEAHFDHQQETKFALTGKHRSVSCHSCHTANVKQQKLEHECVQCHRASDVHAGKLGHDCERCHQTDGWRVDVGFDHDLSQFPLVGLHVTVPCAMCHTSRTYKETASACIDCHRSEDVHKGGLGKDCTSCHSPNGWGIWEFDHAKQTHFALTGAHSKLQCANCHRQPAHIAKLASDCASCHQKDDPHLGQFGKQCQRCHSTVTFKGARLR